jgi:hypothetical protein
MQGPPSPAARLVLGLICIAGGLLPMLAAFDLGPLDADAINGPRWLGLLAGAIFIAGGIGVVLGDRLQGGVLAHALFALTIASFAAIANWIAFGPGPRACAGAVDVVAFTYPDIACRAGFGIGAILLDGFVLWMVAASLHTIFGPGALPSMVRKVGIALMLLALVPIILPLLLIEIARVFIKSCATWRATGRWPQNESFIRRMKAKRSAKP